jgi:translation initiation factor 3 subunit M
MTVGATCVLVETGEEDPIIGVATLVSGLIGDKAGKLGAECGALLEGGKFTDVVSKIMAHGAKLFAEASEKDLEASVLIIGGLAQRLPPADAAKCVDQLVAAALANTAERAAMRATVLFQLYNMVTDAPARLAILNKTLAFVRSAKLGNLVAPLARHVEDNYATWGLDAAATRAMLHDIFSMLSETSGSADPNDAAAKRVLDLQLKFLATYSAGDKLDAAGEETAKAAVVSFVRSSDMMFRCDLLGYAAVQALKGTKSAPVLTLLQTLLTGGGVSDFAAFAKANGALFKTLGLDEAECAGKMKLLALCALAEKSTEPAAGGEVTYAQVAAARQCGEDEVEGWIVRAIGARLVEAKMDQVRGAAVVTRVTHRVFGQAQWTELKQNIENWRDNMAGVREAVAKSVESSAVGLKEVAAH